MKTKFADFVRENRRLQILLLLSECAGYRGNQYLLRLALDGVGDEVSMDALLTDISWLEEQGLVETSVVDEIVVVEMRQRGEDVALGRATVQGVKRPQPKLG